MIYLQWMSYDGNGTKTQNTIKLNQGKDFPRLVTLPFKKNRLLTAVDIITRLQ